VPVPQGVSVAGFDGVPSTATAAPPLTTVRQLMKDTGRVATTMLPWLINGEPLDGMRVEPATPPITRESCAPPCSTPFPGAPAHRLAEATTSLRQAQMSLS